jgi:hypothetical protein
MSLAKMVRPTIKHKFEYPAMPGFEVEITYLSRDELMKIRSKCVTMKIDRKSREPKEEVNNELFEDIYYKSILTGWTGLKYKYLPKLGPFELEADVDPETEEMFDADSGVVLMQNSPEFNSWVTDLLEDVENFTKSS